MLSDFYLLVYGRSKSGKGKGLELIHFRDQTATSTVGESVNIPLPEELFPIWSDSYLSLVKGAQLQAF